MDLEGGVYRVSGTKVETGMPQLLDSLVCFSGQLHTVMAGD